MECGDPTFFLNQDDLDLINSQWDPPGKGDETKEAIDGSKTNEWVEPDLSCELPDHSVQDYMSKNEIQFECDEPIKNWDDYITQDYLNMTHNDSKPLPEYALFDGAKEASDGSEENECYNLKPSDFLPLEDMSKNEFQSERYDYLLEDFSGMKDDCYETGDIVMEETTSVGSSTRNEKPLERAFEQLYMNEADDDIECLR